jgi:hypothetical protein
MPVWQSSHHRRGRQPKRGGFDLSKTIAKSELKYRGASISETGWYFGTPLSSFGGLVEIGAA